MTKINQLLDSCQIPEIVKVKQLDAGLKMPRIALDKIDVLIVYEAGIEISDTGMDTNVIGCFHTNTASSGPGTVKLGILNVTENSDGNGMGLADFMPRHMFDEVNDYSVFQACFKFCGQVNPENIRMAVIRNTKNLDEVYMSPAAVKAAVCPIEVIGDYFEVPFDDMGNLTLYSGNLHDKKTDPSDMSGFLLERVLKKYRSKKNAKKQEDVKILS